ncbi:hypothetical protein UU9_12278 [Rhodanobacter fulvus Jip2]|uniref:Dit-like phage tail protein N-terminal domain-containing protein n=1 Tax=Rhodanobacter fulvus Jip2 TaxID=1163408 RepID=I4VMT4_9GAMM|nr:hypothetical protein [Rhodanobacter fulvus]EIL88525.1 hypothetical protein UU9_12278 [Rhodanobacter fulvus Jip2]
MSTLSGLVKAGAVGALGQLEDVFLHTRRSISYIVPQVTIQEHHRDEVALTDHPIDSGAPVTDHAFSRPSELLMTIGWSDAASFFDVGGSSNNAEDAYPALLELMNQRSPLGVVTGKRTYDNMVIVSLDTVTDAKTNSTLVIEVGMRQVIIVETATTTLAPVTQQQEPEKTAESVDQGMKQPVQPKESGLYQVGGFLEGLL